MNPSTPHCVMLFKAVSYALKAEKILKEEKFPHKLIPVPREISSDCGICLRFDEAFRLPIENCLLNKVEIDSIHRLTKTCAGQ